MLALSIATLGSMKSRSGELLSLAFRFVHRPARQPGTQYHYARAWAIEGKTTALVKYW